MIKKILFLLIIFNNFYLAQVINWEPVYVTENDSITIIFNADEGDEGLNNYNKDDIYAHIGVITNQSSSSSDWKHAPGKWGDNKIKYKLKLISNNKYQLKILPSIKKYFNLTDDETVKSVAIVFRNKDCNKTGRNIGGKDIFLPLRTGAKFILPQNKALFKKVGEQLKIVAVKSSIIDSLKLLIDNVSIDTERNDTLNYNLNIEYNKHKIKIEGFKENKIISVDSFYYVGRNEITTKPLPNNILDGINYTENNSVILSLFAPNKNFIYVIGDFNNWEADNSFLMNKAENDSTYWIKIEDLNPSKEYAFQYYVEGKLKIADPYTEKILDPNFDKYISVETYPNPHKYPSEKTEGIVSTFQINLPNYNFEIENFNKPKKENLIIYELLVRDFVSTHNWQTLIDTLDYLNRLGINAIELMPVNEFEGNESWGYNPSFYFALDKYYGTKNKFKEFIDNCHKRGIAVIIDMVLNHSYGESPFAKLYWDCNNNRPTSNNPWYNTVSPNSSFSWGNDFNHESFYTKKLVDRINNFWLEEYKIDGFRFDFTKGFTQKKGDGWNYDPSRIKILKRMGNQIWENFPNTYLILEHLTANSEEKELAESGFLLWGNMNHNYNEATMGYNQNNKSDLTGTSYKARGWSRPNLVSYMESHDEERLMFKNLKYGNSNSNYNIKLLNIALQRIKLATTFFFTIPGPKMIWQFGELGYDFSIDFNGRVGNKPIKWDYLGNINRKRLFQTFAALIKLKKENPIFSTKDFTTNLTGTTKSVVLKNDNMNAIVIGNFGIVSNSISPKFTQKGIWYDFFCNDSINVSDVDMNISLLAGEFKIFTTKKIQSPDPNIILDIEKYNEDILPTDYELFQNYPNPFNPSTTVNYSIHRAGFVSLLIYDITGKEITKLVDKYQGAGNYKIKFEGNKLSSGIYLCVLKINNFRSIKKMLLLK